VASALAGMKDPDAAIGGAEKHRILRGPVSSAGNDDGLTRVSLRYCSSSLRGTFTRGKVNSRRADGMKRSAFPLVCGQQARVKRCLTRCKRSIRPNFCQ
jgi:hypothetical protein